MLSIELDVALSEGGKNVNTTRDDFHISGNSEDEKSSA